MSITSTPRLIEAWLPINEISIEAIREGGALAGHPPVNQLHVWWARRPLVVSRAAVAAALLDADAGHDQFVRALGSTDTVVAERRRMDEIKAAGQWSNVAFSNKRAFTHNLSAAERQWFQNHLAIANPVVLDVTAGGGSIPFEAGRLGLQTIANELNPVAALILRATCQWPQQHGPALLDEYRQVSARFLSRVRQLISENNVYPPEPGQIPDHDNVMSSKNCAAGTVRLHKYVWAYLWSRTVPCPDCNREIPLSPNWRLDGSGKGIRLQPDPARGLCDFEIVDTADRQSKGTVNKGKAACPYPGCGATTPAGYIARQGPGRAPRRPPLLHHRQKPVAKGQRPRPMGQHPPPQRMRPTSPTANFVPSPRRTTIWNILTLCWTPTANNGTPPTSCPTNPCRPATICAPFFTVCRRGAICSAPANNWLMAIVCRRSVNWWTPMPTPAS